MEARSQIRLTGHIGFAVSDPPVLGGEEFIGYGQAQRADIRMALQLHVLIEQLDEEGGLVPRLPAKDGQRDAHFEDLVEFDEIDLGKLAGCGIRIGYPKICTTENGCQLYNKERHP